MVLSLRAPCSRVVDKFSMDSELKIDPSTESLRQAMLEFAKRQNNDVKEEWFDLLRQRFGDDYHGEYMPQPLAVEQQQTPDLPWTQETSTEGQTPTETSKISLGNFVEQVVCQKYEVSVMDFSKENPTKELQVDDSGLLKQKDGFELVDVEIQNTYKPSYTLMARKLLGVRKIYVKRRYHRARKKQPWEERLANHKAESVHVKGTRSMVDKGCEYEVLFAGSMRSGYGKVTMDWDRLEELSVENDVWKPGGLVSVNVQTWRRNLFYQIISVKMELQVVLTRIKMSNKCGQGNGHEHKEVMKLSPSWKKRVWEPGAVWTKQSMWIGQVIVYMVREVQRDSKAGNMFTGSMIVSEVDDSSLEQKVARMVYTVEGKELRNSTSLLVSPIQHRNLLSTSVASVNYFSVGLYAKEISENVNESFQVDVGKYVSTLETEAETGFSKADSGAKMILIQNGLFCNLMQLGMTMSPLILSKNGSINLNIYRNLHTELKVQLEAFFSCVLWRIVQSKLGSSYKQQEVASEVLVEPWRQHTFIAEGVVRGAKSQLTMGRKFVSSVEISRNAGKLKEFLLPRCADEKIHSTCLSRNERVWEPGGMQLRIIQWGWLDIGNYYYGHIHDIGCGNGRDYSLNVPLDDGFNDESYYLLFKPIMGEVMDVFQPDDVVLQCGADSLFGDRVRCLNLLIKGHVESVKFMRSFIVHLLLSGVGGYTIRNVVGCWRYEIGAALGVEVEDKMPEQGYYEYFSPDDTLYIALSVQIQERPPETEAPEVDEDQLEDEKLLELVELEVCVFFSLYKLNGDGNSIISGSALLTVEKNSLIISDLCNHTFEHLGTESTHAEVSELKYCWSRDGRTQQYWVVSLKILHLEDKVCSSRESKSINRGLALVFIFEIIHYLRPPEQRSGEVSLRLEVRMKVLFSCLAERRKLIHGGDNYLWGNMVYVILVNVNLAHVGLKIQKLKITYYCVEIQNLSLFKERWAESIARINAEVLRAKLDQGVQSGNINTVEATKAMPNSETAQDCCFLLFLKGDDVSFKIRIPAKITEFANSLRDVTKSGWIPILGTEYTAKEARLVELTSKPFENAWFRTYEWLHAPRPPELVPCIVASRFWILTEVLIQSGCKRPHGNKFAGVGAEPDAALVNMSLPIQFLPP